MLEKAAHHLLLTLLVAVFYCAVAYVASWIFNSNVFDVLTGIAIVGVAGLQVERAKNQK